MFRHSAIYCMFFFLILHKQDGKGIREELNWKVYIISVNLKAPITKKNVCYVICNGSKALWSKNVYPDQTSPLGVT